MAKQSPYKTGIVTALIFIAGIMPLSVYFYWFFTKHVEFKDDSVLYSDYSFLSFSTALIFLLGGVSMYLLAFGRSKFRRQLDQAKYENEKKEQQENSYVAQPNELSPEQIAQDLISSIKHEVTEETLFKLIVNYLEGGLATYFKYQSKKLMQAYTYGYILENEPLSYQLGEGLPGQVAKDKALIHIDEIHPDHLPISSGLGNEKPQHLYFIPLMIENKVKAVIEIACFNEIKKLQQDTVDVLLNQLWTKTEGKKIMKIKLNIGSKIMLFVTLLVSITVIAEIVISNVKNKQAIEQDYYNQLKVSCKLLNNELEDKLHEFEGFANSSKIRSFVINRGVEIFQPSLTDEEISYALAHDIPITAPEPILIPIDINPTIETIKEISSCEDIFILNRDEVAMYASNEKSIQEFMKYERPNFVERKKMFFVGKVHRDDDYYFSYISIPYYNDEDEFFGVLVCRVDITHLLLDHQHSIHLGEEYGEASFFDISGKTLVQLNDRQDSTFHKTQITPSLYKLANDKTSDISVGKIDLEKGQYLAAWQKIDELDIGLLIKIDAEIALSRIRDLNNWSLYIGIAFIVVSALLTLFFSKVMTRPLVLLKNSMQLISQGALPARLKAISNDEIGKMTKTVNQLVVSLKEKAAFAQRIGRGELDETSQTLQSEKDKLGHALMEMRDSLKKRADKDSLRNWIVSGIAEISDILRNNDNLTSLSEEVLRYITNRVNASQGAFYTLQDENAAPVYIMNASYAYGKKKFLNGKISPGEGLVGQAILEKDTIFRTEIPESYMHISSGILGDQKPTSILIMPLIANDKVYGVIELAATKKFEDGQIQFVKEVSEIIARTIFNIMVNQTTRKLLEESQRMSSELQVQQEELRQNAIEMEASQEEITKTNKELELQIEKVNNAQQRLQELLQNASEVITIYEENMTIKYISPSVGPILGYMQDDLIGKTDFHLLDKSGQKQLKNMLLNLLLNPEEKITTQYSYLKKDGTRIWLEATGVNKLQDASIGGLLVNSRDITERRRAEEEERKRGQMQALSENSPDLITRISEDGNIFYINPTIEIYTGLKPEDLLNKKLHEVDLIDEIANSWNDLVSQVINTQEKCSCETEFTTQEGKRVMYISAIPEFNEANEIESTLIVSHDITTQKQIENEIRNINRKINDSINYAENIQFAIIPDYTTIKQYIPESFIYYKPRDIVSGDFPWFHKEGDNVFVAAVDCTGHGVPGAMISFIGHFLLNDVVISQKVTDTGEILDRLDQMVTETLKQNEEASKIKDGMDIAICKVDLAKGTVQYSGANRPLYHITSKGELNEVKGNKFPIGGGKAYSNKTNFDAHEIAWKKGDAVFFFSDGYPDQFGGPEGRKLGSKTVKEYLIAQSSTSFSELYTKIDEKLVNWMGDSPQTDDILFIGLKN